MSTPSLTRLPREILRRICGYLPCSSALTLLLVCRLLYRDCDDWTVWRDVVRRSLPHPSYVPTVPADDGWKRYVVAGTKAARTWEPRTVKDLEEWLPQLAAQGHADVLHGDLSFLHRLFDPVFTTTPFCAQPTSSEPGTPTWRLAQAAAFCLAVQHLSLPAPSEPSDRLSSVPWFRLADSNQQEVLAEDRGRRIVMQHALANRAISFFCTKLRYALANGGTSSQSTVGLFAPPTASTIPFPRFMDLPLPFTPGGPEHFSKCHLPTATVPTFFTDDEWTGYITLSRQGDGRCVNGIGGSHRDGFAPANSGMSTPPGHFPHGRHFERVVRFRLVEEYDGNRYRLQSNNFHSELDLHNLSIMVEKDTGHLIITHWHPRTPDFITSDAIITPFGIVSRLLPSEPFWMWLWKVQWSESMESCTGRKGLAPIGGEG